MSVDPRSEVLSNGLNYTKTIRNDTYPFIDPKKSDLSGKAVLITGASRGLGREAALAYAKAGASFIILAARSHLADLEKEVRSAATQNGRDAPKTLSISVDITSLESVQAAAKKVEEAFGRLDILLNNAGYLEEFKPVAESDPDEWWKVFTINVKGSYLVTRAFIPLLLKGGDKTIVNVSSIGAHVLVPGASGYQTTKLALLRFTEFVDCEYKDQGLLTYCIHPGGVATELANNMPKEMHHVLVDTPQLSADSIVWLTKEKRDWLAGSTKMGLFTGSSNSHGRSHNSTSHHSSSGYYARPTYTRPSSSSFFSRSGSSSYYKRRPRDGYIAYLVYKLKRLIQELWYYARRHPVKTFFAIILPLISAGGALGGLAAGMGIKLPMGLSSGSFGGANGYRGGYYGSAGYGSDFGRGSSGFGSFGSLGSMMKIAQAFL
ncbi:hypothetical protein LTR28_003336 [Elasticomyces elasticus]|nr:hypothetical protein LTR28_003336 [Elasticomyces elasticus]